LKLLLDEHQLIVVGLMFVIEKLENVKLSPSGVNDAELVESFL